MPETEASATGIECSPDVIHKPHTVPTIATVNQSRDCMPPSLRSSSAANSRARGVWRISGGSSLLTIQTSPPTLTTAGTMPAAAQFAQLSSNPAKLSARSTAMKFPACPVRNVAVATISPWYTAAIRKVPKSLAVAPGCEP